MSRKPDPKYKLQADSLRELQVALDDEADRLRALGYRSRDDEDRDPRARRNWLPPGHLLNWIVSAFFAMEPAEREEFAAKRGRSEFLRLLAHNGPQYYAVLGDEPDESDEAPGLAGGTIHSEAGRPEVAPGATPKRKGAGRR